MKKFKQISNKEFSCIMNIDELEEYDVTIEDLSTNYSAANQFLTTIIDEAKEEGFPMFAHAYDVKVIVDKGLIKFIFTENINAEPGYANEPMARESYDDYDDEEGDDDNIDEEAIVHDGTMVFELKTITDAIRLSKAFPEVDVDSNLYKYNKDYYLTVNVENCSSQEIKSITVRTCDHVDYNLESGYSVEYITEHGTLLRDDAINFLKSV